LTNRRPQPHQLLLLLVCLLLPLVPQRLRLALVQFALLHHAQLRLALLLLLLLVDPVRQSSPHWCCQCCLFVLCQLPAVLPWGCRWLCGRKSCSCA
jgi:hypothetical protein